MPSAVTPAFQAGDSAVVVRAEDVDDPIELADKELVAVVRRSPAR